MDPDPHGQADSILLLQSAIECPQCLHHGEPGPHCPLRIVFMRLGIAKVDQQTITEILGDMASETLNDLGAGGLIRPDHLAQVFGIEAAGGAGGVHQVAEQHRELATFGVGR